VRCPKCQRPLASSNKRGAVGAGGTAVDGGASGLPMLPIIGGGVVALGIILYFVLGKSDAAKPKATDPGSPVAEEQPADEPDDTPTPTPAPTQAVVPVQLDTQNRIDPNAIAADLERALRNQRLWSSVEIVGKDVQVTTGSCRDASLMPTVSAAAQALRNAGLTRVRCLENSGAVVFERAL
jgi:hypothetical protein